MQLTNHFKTEEFEKSSTAQRLGIDNTVPAALIPELQYLCRKILEPLRQHFDVPIVISSGYRCPVLNAAVGGAKDSQHQYGEAADIRVPSVEEGSRWFAWMRDNLPFDQLIWERSASACWIHASIKRNGRNRQQVLRITLP